MSDEDLIKLLRSSETDQRRGLRLLYQGKGREFGRYFLRCGMITADAEDAVQETILKILKYSTDFTGEGTAKSWMWAVARNTMIDWQRRQNRNREKLLSPQNWDRRFEGADDEVSDDIFSDTLEIEDRRQKVNGGANHSNDAFLVENCVSNGIKKFSNAEPERAYVMSLHIEGLDGREISERIGRSYEATRQYLLQCRQKLAPYISECLELLRT